MRPRRRAQAGRILRIRARNRRGLAPYFLLKRHIRRGCTGNLHGSFSFVCYIYVGGCGSARRVRAAAASSWGGSLRAALGLTPSRRRTLLVAARNAAAYGERLKDLRV